MIELKNVSKTYPDGSIGLNTVNLVLPDHGFILIKGVSGSGKTTLLNLLGGIIKSSTGQVLYNGKNIQKIKNYTLNYIGYIFQDYNLFQNLNVFHNINFLCESTDDLLEKVGIKNLKMHQINEISGGEAKRVAMARAICKKARILLCDEPTASLDHENIIKILDLLKKISQNILVVIVSHNDIVDTYADQIITIEDHQIKSITNIHSLENNSEVKNNPFNLKFPFKKFWQLTLVNMKNNRMIVSLNVFFMTLIFAIALFSLSLGNIKINEIEASAIAKSTPHRMFIQSEEDMMQNAIIKFPWADSLIPIYAYYDENNAPLAFASSLSTKFDQQHSNLLSPNIAFISDKPFMKDDVINGNYPQNSKDIIISEYLYEVFKRNGIMLANGEYYYPLQQEDLLNRQVKLGNYELTITGIYQHDITKYNIFLRDNLNFSRQIETIYNMFNDDMNKNLIYVHQDFENNFSQVIKTNKLFLVHNTDKDCLLDISNAYNNENWHTLSIYTNVIKNVTNLINIIKRISIWVLVVLLIIAFINVINFFNSELELYANDNKILKYLGFNSWQISKIYINEFLLLLLSAFIISIILYYLIIKAFNYLFYSIIYFKIDVVLFDLLYAGWLLIGIIIMQILFSFIITKKVNDSLKKAI